MPATLDARTLRDAMSRYLEALTAHREEIDSLNVYPVPDGDTGTNMLLTQQSVEDALRDLDEANLPEVADAISRAALMGARGNSGVILSQVLRGMCARLSTKDDPGAIDLAEALTEAADEARRAVANPVEGTMLTVLRDAADAARAALKEGQSCEAVAEAALAAATGSLERTKEQLPSLAAAGVVDAGGKGIVLLLDALVAALRGIPLSVGVGPMGPVGQVAAATQEDDATSPQSFGYEVMYLLACNDEEIPALKEQLGKIGDSLVVVGGGGMFNVHVHTQDPGKAVESGVEAGQPSNIRITDLSDQVEACLGAEARGVRVGVEDTTNANDTAPMVAVAEGEGFVELFRSLGAKVVRGSPGNDPPVGDLLTAIEGISGETVFLLPNHRNVRPAARAAAEQSGKTVEVLATASLAHGLAVASRFTHGMGEQQNLRAMREHVDVAASGALARAHRDSAEGTTRVRIGDWVAIVYDGADGEGRIVHAGSDPVESAAAIPAALGAETKGPFELLTLYVGADAEVEDTQRVEKALGEAFPHLEVEVQPGGQPRYPYLIGLE